MTGFFAISSIVFGNHGGQYRTRTCDPMHVKQDKRAQTADTTGFSVVFLYLRVFRPHLAISSSQFAVVFLSYFFS